MKKLWIWVSSAFLVFFVAFFFLSFTNHKKPLAKTLLTLPYGQTDTSTLQYLPIASSGCGKAFSLPKGRSLLIQMDSAHLTRTFRLFVPSQYKNSVPHALVFSFHGYASNASSQELLTHFDHLATAHNFIAVYPNGTKDQNGVKGWNTGLHRGITSNDVLFVSNLMSSLQKNICIDPERIYVSGFSNGGGFVNLLACMLPRRIAAFATVSGSYISSQKPCQPGRPISIIEFHGTADHTVPYKGNKEVHESPVFTWATSWAEKDGCEDKPKIDTHNNVISYTWPQCQQHAAIIQYKILGGRHQWPAFNFSLDLKGKEEEMSTTSLIWDFFYNHPLNS